MTGDQRFQWLKEDLSSMKTELKSDINEVKKSVDGLNQFKWKAIGFSIAISFITTVAFQIYATFYK